MSNVQDMIQKKMTQKKKVVSFSVLYKISGCINATLYISRFACQIYSPYCKI